MGNTLPNNKINIETYKQKFNELKQIINTLKTELNIADYEIHALNNNISNNIFKMELYKDEINACLSIINVKNNKIEELTYLNDSFYENIKFLCERNEELEKQIEKSKWLKFWF